MQNDIISEPILRKKNVYMRQPEELALLVIDMQEHFRSMAVDIVENLNSVINTARDAGILVIYTQHGHVDPKVDGGALDRWWGDNIIRKSKAWELLSELTPPMQFVDVIIDEKMRYDAFHNTRLNNILVSHGVKTVLISGVMTNLCCETTARAAFVRDYDVMFLGDGTATATDKMHKATLENIAFGFGRVLSCGEFLSEVKEMS